ncbi:MAG TPA: hypothetical protein VFT58_03170, partial [Nitrososphaera sp.]|nr:hypothetical protein [Nitrososphaera sp.]
MVDDPFMTFEECGQLLGGRRPLSRKTLNWLIRQGELRDNGLPHKARRIVRASALALVGRIEAGTAS